MNIPVRFKDADDESLYGGKAVSLGTALRVGLPAPDGYALDVALVEVVARNDKSAIDRVRPIFDDLAPSLAVRSSAVGEDSTDASFAGQHLTVLNVTNSDAMIHAIKAVHASAHAESALAYREKMEIPGPPQIAVAVQQLIHSEMAGVMFTRNPVTQEAERYIEASWGLGEVIVAGLVVPDSFRIAADGSILEETIGEKDIKLVCTDNGSTAEVPVDQDRIEAPCLNARHLQQLHELASACQGVYGQHLDIEWAFFEGKVYLLQCRAITR